MTIKEFYDIYSSSQTQSIRTICGRWEKEEQLDKLLQTPITTSVVLGDLMAGDGLNDQISSDLLDGFSKLMENKADSYDEVRSILLSKLHDGDSSVFGMINKIKGQIGENQFIQVAKAEGLSARLADLGNQEGYDVAIDHADGTTRYIQVKMYGDAAGVVEHIQKVNQKLAEGVVISDGDRAVRAIDFAVPADISEEVRAQAAELGIEVNVLPIPMTAHEAREIVQEGFDNIGPEALSNLFGQLFGAMVTVAVIHSLVNAFLLYKEAKTADQFLPDTIEETVISTGAIATGMSLELLLNQISMIGGPPTYALVLCTSIATRGVLKRLAKRQDYISWLRAQNAYLQSLNNQLEATS
ncbi:MAG: hypothetical protein HYW01_05775 [Deltaproteobacteria bacterium]|nr:hypothetical protein [Deltaproteobacteria bacterium]